MSRRRPWVATGMAVAHVVLAVPALLLLAVVVVGLVLSPLVVGLPILRLCMPAVLALASLHRRMAEHALGRPVPMVGLAPASPVRGVWGWLQGAVFWRCVAWLLYAVGPGLLLGLLVVLLVPGAFALAVVALVIPLDGTGDVGLWLPLGWFTAALMVIAWWRYGAAVGRLRAAGDAAILSPDSHDELARRVQQLADSRSDTVDHSAAELRRIERDLHDGAQARLVSLGMTLGMISELMERDPDGARALLDEARTTTRGALGDLRAVVRGIHPPVLADRGLSGAVAALALDMALPVSLDDTLSERLPAPVESALYFAVAECLTNAAKHAGAENAWVRLGAEDGCVRCLVGDDGRGGADPGLGSGMRGVMRRLAAFDGTMRVASPPGGPTLITLEVPCAWSWPKTMPSSGTA